MQQSKNNSIRREAFSEQQKGLARLLPDRVRRMWRTCPTCDGDGCVYEIQNVPMNKTKTVPYESWRAVPRDWTDGMGEPYYGWEQGKTYLCPECWGMGISINDGEEDEEVGSGWEEENSAEGEEKIAMEEGVQL